MDKERFIGPYVYVGYHCNNDCVFCSENDEYLQMSQYKPLSEIKNDIIMVREKYDFINVMGREPTLRPDLFEILDFIKNLGFKQAGMTTNGRMFSYPQFTQSVLDKGINQIGISISGSNPKTHDRQTKVPGSFNQTIQGIKNIIKQKPEDFSVLVNITLNKINLSEIEEMIKLVSSLGVTEVNILNIAPLSIRSRNKNLIARMSEAGLRIEEALKNADKNFPGIKIWLVEFLPCALPAKLKDYFSPCLEKNPKKVRIPICGKCPYTEKCDGVLEDYINLYGVDEFEISI